MFDKLLEFITVSCVEHGLVNEGEMEEHLKVCSTNEEALEVFKALLRALNSFLE